MRSRLGSRSSEGSQRYIDPGQDHGQNSDDRQYVMHAHNGFPGEIALRRMPTGISSQYDLTPQSSSRALVRRHRCVSIDRKVDNLCKLYI